jgi:hypothetical protein
MSTAVAGKIGLPINKTPYVTKGTLEPSIQEECKGAAKRNRREHKALLRFLDGEI